MTKTQRLSGGQVRKKKKGRKWQTGQHADGRGQRSNLYIASKF